MLKLQKFPNITVVMTFQTSLLARLIIL